MKNAASFDWTVASIEQLTALWANGDSCTEIATAMGGGLTRNAVIGKVTRLNLPKRRNAAGYYVPKPKKERAPRTIREAGNTSFVPCVDEDQDLPPDLNSVAEVEAQPRPATFLGITLIDLAPGQCRYPRTVDAVTLFCGQPKLEDSSYCADCHKRCHSRGGYRLNITEQERERRRISARRNFLLRTDAERNAAA